MVVRVNVGCGQTPVNDWVNYDNSWSVRLAPWPKIVSVLQKAGFISSSQKSYIEFARKSGIKWADATKRIPEKTSSVDVLYSSHMLEHIQPDDVEAFLSEARRILKPGAILRLAVPDVNYHVSNYLSHRDADLFIDALHLTKKKPESLAEKFRYLIVGDRHHQWMYDGASLCRLLEKNGFERPAIQKAGFTTIEDPGSLALDERVPESVFVEAINR